MTRLGLAAFALLTTASAILAEPIAPESIVDAATGDWNKDGRPDLAMLVAPGDNGDMIGIYIYVRDADHDLLKLVSTAPAKISGNTDHEGLFGQDASIAALPSGSIAVKSQNSGIGRDRWEQTLTLAFRNNDFVVAGYTYNAYDTLDPDTTIACDYNVLTGKVNRNDIASRVPPKFVTIADWSEETDRGPCEVN